MISVSLFVLVVAVAQPQPVDVTMLSGQQRSGTMVQLTEKELFLQPESGQPEVIPTADLLEVRRSGESEPTSSKMDDAGIVRLTLVDGSQLQLAGVTTSSKELHGRHSLLGELTIPLIAVHSLRFTPPSSKFDPLWLQLMEKGTKSDMVVLQKPEVLDHLDGVVGAMDEGTAKFLLDGDELSIKREKMFGIIYSRKPSSTKLAARVELVNGDTVAVRSVTADGEQWRLASPIGSAWQLPMNAISVIDFSLGKVVYLSALEPRSVKYTPFYKFGDDGEFYWKFRRNRSLEGKPLRLGQKTYARGLAIHSKTELLYRLGGEYRRFQALLGVDDEITNTDWGAVSIRILGDRKEMYAGECRPRQTPIPLDLDVTDVVELEIIVDWGPDKSDIGDRIHLADARLVK
jgi:hypothetical protein